MYLQNVWPLSQIIINDPINGKINFIFNKNGTRNDLRITYHDNFASNAPINILFAPDDCDNEIFDITEIKVSFQCTSDSQEYVYQVYPPATATQNNLFQSLRTSFVAYS